MTKTNPGLTKIHIGLGLVVNKYDGGVEFDLDSATFLLTKAGKLNSDKDFCFCNNKKHESDAVDHSGNNRTGDGDGDNEVIKIDFTITIHEAYERKQNFGQVSNAYIRVSNEAYNTELICYDLGEDYLAETAIVVAELYLDGTEWKFNVIGSGFSGGLKALFQNFGVEV